ncbi:DUF4347 domain-containing protein [Anabaena sp. WFMT]|uniref:DUF4347 domain-containing protein n=1 Tax=Anabaena sp. WFMT TaxID=3449730 RepID=UPI003F2573F5
MTNIRCTRRTLVVIDADVDNYEFLIKGILSDADVILLDQHRNGIAQIAEVLQSGVFSALQIVAHGSEGELRLGNIRLNLSNLLNYATALQSWQVDEISLYACEVASGATGQDFVKQLAVVTGARVAAATTKVGNRDLGGTWSLAVQTGAVTTPLMIENDVLVSYAGVFGTVQPETITITANGVNTDVTSDSNGTTTTYTNTGNGLQVENGLGGATFNVDGVGSGFISEDLILNGSGYTNGDVVNLNGSLNTNDFTISNVQTINVNNSAALSIFDTPDRGDVNWTVGQSIFFNSGSSLTTTTGDATGNIDLTALGLSASVDSRGIDVDGASITSTDGMITLNGKGSGTNTGSNNYGIIVHGTNSTVSSVTGAIAVTGIGGAGPNNSNHGVFVTGSTATISSQSGDIAVTGTGGGTGSDNIGVRVDNYGSIKTQGTGTITVTATGGGNPSVGNVGNRGLLLETNGKITSADGNITINATGVSSGNGNDGIGAGIDIRSNALISSANGNISVTGTGGSRTNGDNIGVYLLNGAITTTAIGDIEVIGTGGGTSADGIKLEGAGSKIESNIGAIALTGTGTTTGFGINLLDGTAITSTTGNITLKADRMNLAAGDNTISSNGSLTILQKTDGTTIGLGSGTGTLNLTASQILSFKDGFAAINIGDTNSGTVDINNVTFTDPLKVISGDGITVSNDTYISLDTGSSLTAIGNITLKADTMNLVGGNNTISSNGSLTILQKTNGTTIALGYFIVSQGQLGLTAAEILSFKDGFTSINIGDVNSGAVSINNVTFTDALNVASGSDINVINTLAVTGAGASLDSKTNILFNNSSSLTASGNINLLAQGGLTTVNSRGIDVNGASITSADGMITLNGKGSGTSTGNNNYGVIVQGTNSTISSVTGAIAVIGTGGAGSGNSNHGVFVTGSTATISSQSGDIAVTGTGGGTGSDNIGVRVDNYGSIKTQGTGTITVTATGGGNPSVGNVGNRGLLLETSGKITSADGNITINATGVSSGNGNDGIGAGIELRDSNTLISSANGNISVTGTGGTRTNGDNRGIYLLNGAAITTTATGNIDVIGTGGGTFADGIKLEGAGSKIQSNIGAIALTGTGTTTGVGINLLGGTAVTSTSGNITLKADSMNLAGGNNTISSNGSLTILQKTNGTTIGLGTGAGTLSLTAAEISSFKDGFAAINIGDVNSGAVNINAPTFNDSLNVTSGISIDVNSSLAVAGNINLLAQGGLTTTNSIGINVNNTSVTSTTDGTITLSGKGSGTAIGSGNYGVIVQGFWGRVSSVNGAIAVTGTGGSGTNFNYGVYLNNYGIISSTGTATITVTGQGSNTATGTNNHGVIFEEECGISSVNGAIAVTGTGGSGTNFNYGVIVSNFSGIGSTGTAAITVTGQASTTATGTNNHGVFVDTFGLVRSVSGAIAVTGTGGGTSGDGIRAGGAIQSNSGAISLTGTGSGTGFGINLINGGAISSTTGNINLLSSTINLANTASITTAGNIFINQDNDVPVGATTLGATVNVTAGNLYLNDTIKVDYNSGLSRFDTVNLTGAVDLVGSTLNLDLTGYTAPTTNSFFTLINNDGTDAVTGTFTGLAEGAQVGVVGGYNIFITYQGGSGNDVQLYATANNTPTNLSISANSINENVATNSLIGTFSTTDPDAGNTFIYSFVNGTNDNSAFTISGNQLLINASPNFEAKSSYSILVRTTDGGGLSYDKALTININDVNEAPTAVSLNNQVTAIAENTSTVTRIKVADIAITDDALGTNNLSLSGTDASFFEVDGNALYLNANTALNFEAKTSYSVTVNVDDSTVGSTPDATANFTLNITDVNEAPTAVNLNNQVIAIAQNTSTATRIKVADIAIADDALGTNNLSVSGTDASFFEVDAMGLYLKAGTAINYEAKPSYNVTVNVDDNTLGSTPDATTNFTLNITDVNEAPTAVNLNNQVTAIAENTSTTTRIKVADIAITDDALGTNSLSVSGTDASFFEVDSTGLYLKANTALNFEAKTSYSVTVNVDDTTVGSNPDATTNFTLTVTDVNEAPTAVSLTNQLTVIAENTSTATRIKVADVTITDDALGINNLSLSGTDASFFEVDVTGLYIKANTVLNYEAKTSYSVTINVDDITVGSTPDATTNFTLNATNVNEAPTALSLSATSINENVAINSTVGTFSSSDPDSNETFTYSLVTGAGSTNNSSFTIVNNQLRLKISPNFESKASYLVRVRSTDTGGLFTESPFTITINNLPTNTITGTIANETFTATNELDIIDGDGGNDKITATVVNLQSGESFDGNTGIDTFTLSQGNLTDVVNLDLSLTNQLISLTGVSGVTLRNFENINITGFKGRGTIAGSNVANNLTGGVYDDTINGGDGNDVLNGGGGNDTLTGGGGNDALNGETGADSLTGGTGNDVYYIDNAGDFITELSGEGTDTVFSTLNYSLVGTYLENLTLQGTAINGTGNAFDNRIIGNASNNFLIGGDGNDILNGETGVDSLIGGRGNDIYYIDNAGDTITELQDQGNDTVFSTVDFSLVVAYLENLTLQGTAINGTGNGANNGITGNASNNILIGYAGKDVLNGGAGNDVLDGGTGEDVLNGGTGADSMIGGTGDDLYFIDNTGDTITELSGQGTDSVSSSIDYSLVGTYLENLTLQGTAINGTGNAFDNNIFANASNNFLIGGDGKDLLLGRAGNDILMGGDGDDILNGDEGNDILTGGAGNDVLNGGAGADSLTGGTGDDRYSIDNAGDTITELSGQGTDSVSSSIDYSLVGTYLENLTLQGTAINGTGNEFDNRISGNDNNNFLIGGNGNDDLRGNGGNDILIGGDGNDVLYGGSGSNTLTGGRGNDSINLINGFDDDLVLYTFGDGTDTIRYFNKQNDQLAFTGIGFIDVKVSGSNTELRLSDGIQGNPNFGTGTLLETILGVTGLNGTVLAPSNTATFLFG